MATDLPKDVLGVILAQLQLRRDFCAAACVCKVWNAVASSHIIQKNRIDMFRNTCCLTPAGSLHRFDFMRCSDAVNALGEYECERCHNALCQADSNIRCARCNLRICPQCCIGCPVCLNCASQCEAPARESEVPCVDMYIYCSDCDRVSCAVCIVGSCIKQGGNPSHTTYRVSNWRVKLL